MKQNKKLLSFLALAYGWASQSHDLSWDALTFSLLQIPFCVQDLNQPGLQWHMDSLKNETKTRQTKQQKTPFNLLKVMFHWYGVLSSPLLAMQFFV